MDNKTFMDEVICYNGKRKAAFYGITIGMCIIIAGCYLLADRLFPFSQEIAELVLMSICVFTLGRFYRRKEKYIDKFGREQAYVHAFYRFHVTTMPFIYMSALHPIYAANNQKLILPIWARVLLGVYFIGSALILHRKSIKIFGMDNLFMYYVYFPEKSQKTESVIHSMLRHPIYSAMARVSIGTGFAMGTIDSILLGCTLPIFQVIWLRVFEEKELLERFPTYREYMDSTNAIINRPKNLLRFWKFIFTPVSKN